MSNTETTSPADQRPTTPSITPELTRSDDGTPIAFETYGSGPVVVVVGGGVVVVGGGGVDVDELDGVVTIASST